MTHCPPNGRDPNPRPMQRGKDGKDAYQVWVDRQPVGADTSWCAYMEAIQGDDAYEVWVEHQPEGADTSWQAYLNAIRGESAYQIWVEYQPEGADTSIEAYLDYMAGKKGDPGEPNVLSIGTVTTLDPDQPAAAEITGETPAQVLNLSIPQGKVGDEGPSNVLTIGTVTTGAPTDPAAAEITGESPAQVLNLTIPQGTPGKVQTVDSRTMKRSGTSGNFSFGYSDAPNSNSACGLYGTAIYLKTTLTLSNALNGDNSPVVICRLSDLPCMSDGTLVAYNFWADYVQVSGQNKPTVAIWLNFPVPPTHLINPTTKAITKLQRSSGQGSGLSSVYPVAPDGEYANEFQYTMSYFYTA